MIFELSSLSLSTPKFVTKILGKLKGLEEPSILNSEITYLEIV